MNQPGLSESGRSVHYPLTASLTWIVLALLLASCGGESPASASNATSTALASHQTANPANVDADKCPLRSADLDKLTPYRWRVVQYEADQSFIPSNGTVRIDICELIGTDGKSVETGVLLNIARGGHAEAFAKYWRDNCSGSVIPEMRGTVQPLSGVSGGQQCVTANGSSSNYWIESEKTTIHILALTDDPVLAEIFPQLLAAIVR